MPWLHVIFLFVKLANQNSWYKLPREYSKYGKRLSLGRFRAKNGKAQERWFVEVCGRFLLLSSDFNGNTTSFTAIIDIFVFIKTVFVICNRSRD